MESGSFDWTYGAMAAPFLAAVIAPWVKRWLGAAAGWALSIVPALMFIHFLQFLPLVADNSAFANGFVWIWQIDVNFSYLIDGLSLLFALLITGIGTFIIIYSGSYLKGHPNQGRFFSFMFLFMGSMLGLVLADDFITLFIFWELTSITSFLLIGFDHTRQAARRAALQALIVTGLGGLSLLAAFLLLIGAEDLRVSTMTEAFALGQGFKEHSLYLPVLILMLGGAFTKSAQVPFHSWLPNAMEAPTPVSAYLHSATMVKAGVYLIMRIHPFMGNSAEWNLILPLFGGLTLLVGTVLAIRQTDLKLILAYTTVASLGLLVMLTGTSLTLAVYAAILYLFAHSLFKGALFLVAGGIDHEAGSRDLTRLGGLRSSMPITFAVAFIAACSMAGFPLTIGFFAKETMYDALVHETALFPFAPVALLTPAVLGVAIIGNALMMACGFAVAIKPFAGPAIVTPKHAHDGPVGLWIGAATLALCGVLAILFGAWVGHRLIEPAGIAVTFYAEDLHISPALHLNAAFALSGLTWLLGLVVFMRFEVLRGAIGRMLDAIGWGPDKGFDQLIAALTKAAAALTRTIQTGDLQHYITLTLIVLAASLILPISLFAEWPTELPEMPLTYYEWAVLGLAIIGLAAVLMAKSRLIAIVSLGIQGFAVALLFMIFGAPDLSFTQFMVETLSVVILALVMTRLALHPSDHRPVAKRLLHIAISVACGGAIGALLMTVTALPFDSTLSDFFAQNSRVIAHGRNIVNVIIVDFRGLDTLGEITVVMVAGLAVLALLRLRVLAPESGDGQQGGGQQVDGQQEGGK